MADTAKRHAISSTKRESRETKEHTLKRSSDHFDLQGPNVEKGIKRRRQVLEITNDTVNSILDEGSIEAVENHQQLVSHCTAYDGFRISGNSRVHNGHTYSGINIHGSVATLVVHLHSASKGSKEARTVSSALQSLAVEFLETGVHFYHMLQRIMSKVATAKEIAHQLTCLRDFPSTSKRSREAKTALSAAKRLVLDLIETGIQSCRMLQHDMSKVAASPESTHQRACPDKKQDQRNECWDNAMILKLLQLWIATVPRHIERNLAYLEDALGRFHEVDLGSMDWTILHCAIETSFKHQPGCQKVARKQYRLSKRSQRPKLSQRLKCPQSDHLADPERPPEFRTFFRSRQLYLMSIHYENDACPRCSAFEEPNIPSGTVCIRCNFTYCGLVVDDRVEHWTALNGTQTRISRIQAIILGLSDSTER